ncbi:hypothetical protein [Candidatus Aalborgicola defluviihabitans]|uniref:hypothetical protein n=1 Tax=Candidatus Aalborgicola defluviihabitans TaxID=3386187 RepID=UPI0039B9505E
MSYNPAHDKPVTSIYDQLAALEPVGQGRQGACRGLASNETPYGVHEPVRPAGTARPAARGHGTERLQLGSAARQRTVRTYIHAPPRRSLLAYSPPALVWDWRK